MTVTPDPNQPHDQPPDDQNPPTDDQNPPVDDQPTDAVTSVTSVTAAPDPAPAESGGPGEDGHEVAVETTRSSAAHMIAFPGPIPDYTMETSVERSAAAPASDPVDTAPTRRHPDDAGLDDAGLTVPLTVNPPHPRPPDPPDLPPEPPYLAPAPPYPVAPVAAVRAGPAYPEASVRPRRRPLFGTIVWGVILLTLAGYVLLGVLVPTPADPTLWLLGGVIVVGLLLIVIGIIATLRRAG
ncbi:hypothetical protein [Cryobacterium sp. TMT3-29-2]|uniref:hypothetical protein n=1 Tax=Cryobacterium sp. TMT3-29-2 TaxID=2555867 RepID=UPI0010743E2D|nr:hypothetical protein [Cryobacterium sp. TMT3-29-2]TFC92154.1 hypothetical protein E3O67_03485 [Cryobacterium sp. TMT3-29-2]